MWPYSQAERLDKAWRREHGRFTHDYNDKLFNGLVLLLLVDIIVFRFLVRVTLLETIGWALFVFLQARLPLRRCRCVVWNRSFCGQAHTYWSPPGSGGLAERCVVDVGPPYLLHSAPCLYLFTAHAGIPLCTAAE